MKTKLRRLDGAIISLLICCLFGLPMAEAEVAANAIQLPAPTVAPVAYPTFFDTNFDLAQGGLEIFQGQKRTKLFSMLSLSQYYDQEDRQNYYFLEVPLQLLMIPLASGNRLLIGLKYRSGRLSVNQPNADTYLAQIEFKQYQLPVIYARRINAHWANAIQVEYYLNNTRHFYAERVDPFQNQLYLAHSLQRELVVAYGLFYQTSSQNQRYALTIALPSLMAHEQSKDQILPSNQMAQGKSEDGDNPLTINLASTHRFSHGQLRLNLTYHAKRTVHEFYESDLAYSLRPYWEVSGNLEIYRPYGRWMLGLSYTAAIKQKDQNGQKQESYEKAHTLLRGGFILDTMAMHPSLHLELDLNDDMNKTALVYRSVFTF